MVLHHSGDYADGYELLVLRDSEKANMMMDFASLSLKEGAIWRSNSKDERALLLAEGSVEIMVGEKVEWIGAGEGRTPDRSPVSVESLAEKGTRIRASRVSLLEENPAVLHLPAGTDVAVKALSERALLYITATVNGTRFAPRLYLPYECQVEYRNEGTMQGTGTRIVRTVFNKNNAPWSNLVLGEDINLPGRWSSYPSHHHPQPEIYHYRFFPSQGFGMTALGTEAYQLHDRDTLLITDNKDHPQVAAPGYTMWYLWVIRHIEGNPYISPEFNPDHVWVDQPGAKIWDMKRTGR
ncbi:MAG: 5-deoxy-glucuronate isomerase [Rectinema sp.]|jgi:5-deoxy-glucuronate isomerase|uniref:Myo-inositol catabolism IolB domain protein n=1 Tax=uncultured spirochete TaxID=156406 RepID=A0A3P3XRR5_9SPIR|nr:Myo-inositol catabolism IolB domain protein [uncultured spirochete]